MGHKPTDTEPCCSTLVFNELVARDIATEFYYWWHNQEGSNTQQGFDEWWRINKKRFSG